MLLLDVTQCLQSTMQGKRRPWQYCKVEIGGYSMHFLSNATHAEVEKSGELFILKLYYAKQSSALDMLKYLLHLQKMKNSSCSFQPASDICYSQAPLISSIFCCPGVVRRSGRPEPY